jgi:hypothetical protein
MRFESPPAPLEEGGRAFFLFLFVRHKSFITSKKVAVAGVVCHYQFSPRRAVAIAKLGGGAKAGAFAPHRRPLGGEAARARTIRRARPASD